MEQKRSSDDILWTYHQTTNQESLLFGNPRQEMLFSVIKKHIQKNGKILEIGFGNGYLLNALSSQYRTYGADISVENIEQMSKKVKAEFELVSSDGKLPYPDETFDAFVASEVLEHMDDKELVVCIEEAFRILKKGGYAIITIPAEEDLKKNECFCPNCEHVFHKWGHKQYWNKTKIRKVFATFQHMAITEYFNRYTSEKIGDKIFGYVVWGVQTLIGHITSFPNKFVTNRTYVVILRK
jgi:ubiquinone/menaquinone biosynthesis C-methylase UbiE